jgi:hypothetical protein
MLKSVIKYFVILVLAELVLFIGLAATTMTDDKVPAIANYFYWPLKYLLGFPLVLLNRDYPYFLDRGGNMMAVISLGLLNNLLLAGLLVGMYNICKRLLKV